MNACLNLQLVSSQFFLSSDESVPSSCSPQAWVEHSRNGFCHCLFICAVPFPTPAVVWLVCCCKGALISHSNNYSFLLKFWQCCVCVRGGILILSGQRLPSCPTFLPICGSSPSEHSAAKCHQGSRGLFQMHLCCEMFVSNPYSVRQISSSVLV